MVTLQKSGKRKNHSNRVKITLKKSENHSKASENRSKESENHSKRVNFTSWGKLAEGQLFCFELSLYELPPRSEIHSFGVIFTLFGAIFTRFGMIFTLFEGDFHSISVVFMLPTLLKSNHFTLFTLRE